MDDTDSSAEVIELRPTPSMDPDGPRIELGVDIADAVRRTVAALAQWARDRAGGRGLYRRSTGATLVMPTPAGELAGVDVHAIRVLCHEAATVCRWRPRKGEGAALAVSTDGAMELAPAPMPRDIAEAVISTWPTASTWAELPVLDRIAPSPCLLPNGRVLQPGEYDAAHGVMVAPGAGAVDVPDSPTREDAVNAARALLAVACDFPFVAEADKSAWLSLLLTIVARPCFMGPTPIFVASGNEAGTGKGKLVNAAAIIATGAEADPRKLPGAADEEQSKVITAIARKAPAIALFDNARRPIGGEALEAIATATRWGGRLLRTSEDLSLPWATVLAVTANSPDVAGDMARRIIPIRLHTDRADPENRAGFVHPDLERHIRENRARYLAAALTIARAYLLAGSPAQVIMPMGSYEAWSAFARAALVWLELADPIETRETVEDSDPVAEALETVARSWPVPYPGGEPMPLRSAEILRRFAQDDPLGEALGVLISGRDGREPTAADVGYCLRRYRGRIAGGRELRHSKNSDGRRVWTFATIAARPGPEPPRGCDTPSGAPLKPTPADRAKCYTPSAVASGGRPEPLTADPPDQSGSIHNVTRAQAHARESEDPQNIGGSAVTRATPAPDQLSPSGGHRGIGGTDTRTAEEIGRDNVWLLTGEEIDP